MNKEKLKNKCLSCKFWRVLDENISPIKFYCSEKKSLDYNKITEKFDGCSHWRYTW